MLIEKSEVFQMLTENYSEIKRMSNRANFLQLFIDNAFFANYADTFPN